MIIIGLTGTTGAGKSTVAKYLVSKGFYHIDADKVAKDVINNTNSVKDKLKAQFGNDVINFDGTTSRKILAERAFKDRESTEKLNKITHPAINKKIMEIIEIQKSLGVVGCIIDAIGLFESGEDKLCHVTIAVSAPLNIRLERIISRDNISEKQALLRISAQKNQEYYEKLADYTVKNYGTFEIKNQIDEILKNI